MVRAKIVPFVFLLSLALGIGAISLPVLGKDSETAIFAGGCFWCVEHLFDEVDGVYTTTSGYIGGHLKNPDYKTVSAGGTGHTEAVEVRYDPTTVTYTELLRIFWRNIDPTTRNRQFCDRGRQYRSGIFYLNNDQKRLAEASRRKLQANKPFSGPIVTEITAAGPFYPAEVYHQDYHHKNPIRYRLYRYNCGRDRRLRELWEPG